MQVFVSWSKPRSHQVALAVKNWLPTVIQDCRDVFVSSEQEKGVEWFTNIAQNLDEAAVGLVIITPENQGEEWLNFEAGALLGKFERRRLCPVLVDLAPGDYAGPLKSLQFTEIADQDDVLKLLNKINEASTAPLAGSILERTHQREWDDFRGQVQDAIDSDTTPPPQRSDSDKIDEMLAILRGLDRSSFLAEQPLTPKAVVKLLAQQAPPARNTVANFGEPDGSGQLFRALLEHMDASASEHENGSDNAPTRSDDDRLPGTA